MQANWLGMLGQGDSDESEGSETALNPTKQYDSTAWSSVETTL